MRNPAKALFNGPHSSKLAAQNPTRESDASSSQSFYWNFKHPKKIKYTWHIPLHSVFTTEEKKKKATCKVWEKMTHSENTSQQRILRKERLTLDFANQDE